jgi:hypothetical protein
MMNRNSGFDLPIQTIRAFLPRPAFRPADGIGQTTHSGLAVRNLPSPTSKTLRLSALVAGLALAGCAMPSHSTRLAGGPEPVTVRIEPAVLRSGQEAMVVVRSPSADSIALESANGLDRYWSAGPRLNARLSGDFGDPRPLRRYAERRDGALLDRLKKPATISVCKLGRCREFYHEFEVRLPERNRRTVAIAAGWNTMFAHRTITGRNRTALFQQALSSGVFSVEGELAAKAWSAKAQAFFGADTRGASVDLSRVIKQGDEVSYGVAMHLGTSRNEWLPDGTRPALADRTAYRASIGPSIMLRGVTASSQFGIYASGRETLQIIGTRISANGRLTSVRIPVSITAEKTLAFGHGPIVSRRRDALERLAASVHLLDGFAVNVGVSSQRIAWPGDQPSGDLRASEVLFTLGGRYLLTW